MVTGGNVYGEVNGKTDLREIFREIRKDVAEAHSRPALTELYRRAGYLITLTYSPAWEAKFGNKAAELRATAEEEFARTARAINKRARTIGTEPDYDERWGPGR